MVKTKSISKAARKLHISQPAVSQQIQAMEQLFNVTLFKRSNQGVSLTEPGQLVYEYAQRILALVSDLEQNLDTLMGVEDQSLSIGASPTIGNYSVPCSLWAFKQKNPKAVLHLEIRSSKEVLEGVLGSQFSLGLVEGDLCLNKVVKKKIHSEKIVVITPNEFPWSNKDKVSLEELLKCQMIMHEEGSGIRSSFLAALREVGLDAKDLDVTSEMNSISAVKASVQAGLGISICPEIAVRKEIRQGTLLALPIEDLSMEIPFYIIYLPEKFLSSTSKNFIRFLVHPDERQFC